MSPTSLSGHGPVDVAVLRRPGQAFVTKRYEKNIGFQIGAYQIECQIVIANQKPYSS